MTSYSGDMRTSYQEKLNQLSHDLLVMGDAVRDIMADASTALLQGSLSAAEEALSRAGQLPELQSRCERKAVEILALESPKARDLRQVLSSIHIAYHLHRMGELATHIAQSARRRHPARAIPAEMVEEFGQLAQAAQNMTLKTRNLLVSPDTDTALELEQDDQFIDELSTSLLSRMTQSEWPHSARESVDTALLIRFYERYADHCVNVAGRVVYLVSGLKLEDYLAQQE